MRNACGISRPFFRVFQPAEATPPRPTAFSGIRCRAGAHNRQVGPVIPFHEDRNAALLSARNTPRPGEKKSVPMEASVPAATSRHRTGKDSSPSARKHVAALFRSARKSPASHGRFVGPFHDSRHEKTRLSGASADTKGNSADVPTRNESWNGRRGGRHDEVPAFSAANEAAAAPCPRPESAWSKPRLAGGRAWYERGAGQDRLRPPPHEPKRGSSPWPGKTCLRDLRQCRRSPRLPTTSGNPFPAKAAHRARKRPDDSGLRGEAVRRLRLP